jgi:hypothetical protein
LFQVPDEAATNVAVHVENLPIVLVDVSSFREFFAESDFPVICDSEWPVSKLRNGLTSNRYKLLLDGFVCLLPSLTDSHFDGALLHVTVDEAILELFAENLLEKILGVE